MTYLMGIDEAGYGPKLGPLIISATLWQIPDSALAATARAGPALDGQVDRDLDALVARVVSRNARDAGRADRLVIADSKQLYHSGKGLKSLERVVLAGLATTGAKAQSWRTLWSSVADGTCDGFWELPWHQQYDRALPVDAAAAEVAAAETHFACMAAELEVRLLAVRAAIVVPGQFNDRCDQCGSKGAALSELALELAAELVRGLPVESTWIVWDKHGGRNKYAALLQQYFPEWRVEVGHESTQESRYAAGPTEGRCRFCFRAGGEAFMPTALASMTAKYLRELSMHAFNAYWRQCVPDIAPTAGYPSDALRFKRAIAAKQRALGIDDRVLWRNR